MNSKLHHIVDSAERRIAETIASRILNTGAPHYRTVEEEQLRARCRGLVRGFVDSIRATGRPFAAHVRRTAERRIEEGYLLHEIQMALTFLEEELWSLCRVEARDKEELYRHLSVVSLAIGTAKDRLAALYLERTDRAERRAARLEDRLAELFRGTEAMVVATE
jgi:hypothetical protein